MLGVWLLPLNKQQYMHHSHRDCDACTVVCVACVYPVRVCEGDGNAGV